MTDVSWQQVSGDDRIMRSVALTGLLSEYGLTPVCSVSGDKTLIALTDSDVAQLMAIMHGIEQGQWRR